MKWMFKTVAAATLMLALTSCDEIFGNLDDPVEPEPTAPTVVKPKLLTKIVSVNGDSNGASKDEITLKYDANSRISSTVYDGITYNYTYGTNTIDVK
ncbi:MAG: hypothetical protein IJ580_07245 [Prevotella sp.]|nr:hypothetical protein [Prevotella sp.]